MTTRSTFTRLAATLAVGIIACAAIDSASARGGGGHSGSHVATFSVAGNIRALAGNLAQSRGMGTVNSSAKGQGNRPLNSDVINKYNQTHESIANNIK